MRSYFSVLKIFRCLLVPLVVLLGGARSASAIAAVSLPDLVITSGAPTVTPTVVAPGGQFTLSAYSFTNTGGTAANAFVVGVYLSVDPVINGGDTYFVKSFVNAGYLGNQAWTDTYAEQVFTIPLWVSPGTYYLGISVDSENTVQESNENNNYVSVPITVEDPGGIDNDGDGYSVNQGDCNDNDPSIYPGAFDYCGDGIDQDCDGVGSQCRTWGDLGDYDEDYDGFTPNQGDCNDADPTVFPGAPEICGDEIDQNCDGVDQSCGGGGIDADGDGFTLSQGDCNDADKRVYPRAPETCGDGIDQNCDGSDPDCFDLPFFGDHDGDGLSAMMGDCDDEDATVFPGATDVCDDGIDQNCDGADETCVPDDIDERFLRPHLIAPRDGEQGVALDVTLKTGPFGHEDVMRSHLMTEWQIGQDQTFETPVLSTKSGTHLQELPVPHLTLLGKTTYFWRVRFFDDNKAPSSWSETFEFRTTAETGDSDGNGIPDDLEVGSNVDLDGNGVPDRDQDDIKSLKTVVGGGAMGIKVKTFRALPLPIFIPSGDDVIIESVNSIDPDSISPFARPFEMPLGLLAATLVVPTPGDTVSAKVYFSQPASPDAAWYVFDHVGGWENFSPRAVFSEDRRSVELEFQDGGAGDADFVMNGRIVDPGGWGVASMVFGSVVDAASGASIPRAKVNIDETTINTDLSGRYLAVIQPGTYDVVVTAEGYGEEAIEDLEVLHGAFVEKDFSLSVMPRPVIRLAGLDGEAALESGADLNPVLGLDLGGGNGDVADWWLVALTPSGWYYLNVGTWAWEPWPEALPPTHQGPLFDIETLELAGVPGLPDGDGDFTFFFGVDLDQNGALDVPRLCYDYVVVHRGNSQ